MLRPLVRYSKVVVTISVEYTISSAATYAGNPCGHSFCGDCGWRWKMKGVGLFPFFDIVTIVTFFSTTGRLLPDMPHRIFQQMFHDTKFCDGQCSGKVCPCLGREQLCWVGIHGNQVWRVEKAQDVRFEALIFLIKTQSLEGNGRQVQLKG